jgi:hypothetical protein
MELGVRSWNLWVLNGKRAGAGFFFFFGFWFLLVVLFQLIREKVRSQFRPRSCSREISAWDQQVTMKSHSLIIITKHKLKAEET